MESIRKLVFFVSYLFFWDGASGQGSFDSLHLKKISSYYSIRKVYVNVLEGNDMSVVIGHIYHPMEYQDNKLKTKKDRIFISRIDYHGNIVSSDTIDLHQQFHNIISCYLDGDEIRILARNDYVVGELIKEGCIYVYYNIKTKKFHFKQLFEEPIAMVAKKNSLNYLFSIENGHHCSPPEYKVYRSELTKEGILRNKKKWSFVLCNKKNIQISQLDESTISVRHFEYYKDSLKDGVCALPTKLFWENEINPYTGYKPKIDVFKIPAFKKKNTLYLPCEISDFQFSKNGKYLGRIYSHIEDSLLKRLECANENKSNEIRLMYGSLSENQKKYLTVPVHKYAYFTILGSSIFIFSKEGNTGNIVVVENSEVKNEVSFKQGVDEDLNLYPVQLMNTIRIYYVRNEPNGIKNEFGYFDLE